MSSLVTLAGLLESLECAGSCKYVPKKLIGSGSYGEAWLVERVEDGVIFVAKTTNLNSLSSRDKDYAYGEIKNLANCNHPNIIRFVESKEQHGHLLIIMEFADSGDLDRQIKNRGNEMCRYFQEHEALFLFIQICLAVHHIHSKQMLHRDIKGANVLLTSAGLIKIGDFGFSHQYDDTVSGVVANTFCGTPYYLAPELWNNQRYSKKADVWSVGVLLYEIMSLKRPFMANNMKDLMSKVLSGSYDELPGVFSAQFRDIVRQILTVNSLERPSIEDIFRIPYIHNGLKVFSRTISNSTLIAEDAKEALCSHVQHILAHEAVLFTTQQLSCTGEINMDVILKGYIYKLKGGDVSHSWKKRFLQLQKGHLIMSANDTDTEGKALGLDQIQSMCPVPSCVAKRLNVFAINTLGGKSMWFDALSHESMEEWIHSIQRGLGVT